MDKKWIAMYSHTGQEIQDISQELGMHPDLVLTDNKDNKWGHKAGTRENINDLLAGYQGDAIVTLHGYMGILPEDVLRNPRLEVYNGHPALITLYPELRGKDPQLRNHPGVVDGRYKVVGTVIHRVTEGVDEGPIIVTNQFVVPTPEIDLPDFIGFMHTMSGDLWVEFLTGVLK